MRATARRFSKGPYCGSALWGHTPGCHHRCADRGQGLTEPEGRVLMHKHAEWFRGWTNSKPPPETNSQIRQEIRGSDRSPNSRSARNDCGRGARHKFVNSEGARHLGRLRPPGGRQRTGHAVPGLASLGPPFRGERPGGWSDAQPMAGCHTIAVARRLPPPSPKWRPPVPLCFPAIALKTSNACGTGTYACAAPVGSSCGCAKPSSAAPRRGSRSSSRTMSRRWLCGGTRSRRPPIVQG
jgi:hypothetical protein